MSNEIKQGDTVRVSKDAPRVFSGDVGVLLDAPGWKVHQVVDDYAFIINGKLSSAIPTKYLIKVDTEAKEPKFKVNDVVRTVFNETTHITAILGNGNYYLYGMGNEYPEDSLTLIQPYIEPTAPKIKAGDRVRNIESGIIGVVDKIVYENIAWVNGVDGKRYHWKSDELELVEPTERMEAEKNDADNLKKVAEEWANTVSNAIEEYGDAMCKIYVEAHNEAYWDAYTADLAKELVTILVRTRSNDLNKVAKMSVDIAKAVVEGLKRK